MDYPSDREDMPTVILAPGQVIAIRFANTDGEFVIAFDCKGSNELVVEADMPDSEGREGVIYREVFSVADDKDEVCQAVTPEYALAETIVMEMNDDDYHDYARDEWADGVRNMCWESHVNDGEAYDSTKVLDYIDKMLLPGENE